MYVRHVSHLWLKTMGKGDSNSYGPRLRKRIGFSVLQPYWNQLKYTDTWPPHDDKVAEDFVPTLLRCLASHSLLLSIWKRRISHGFSHFPTKSCGRELWRSLKQYSVTQDWFYRSTCERHLSVLATRRWHARSYLKSDTMRHRSRVT